MKNTKTKLKPVTRVGSNALVRRRWEKIDGDYITYRFPHRKIRRYMASYLRSWWKPRWISGDAPFWPKHSWHALACEWWRLLKNGSREYRWD